MNRAVLDHRAKEATLDLGVQPFSGTCPPVPCGGSKPMDMSPLAKKGAEVRGPPGANQPWSWTEATSQKRFTADENILCLNVPREQTELHQNNQKWCDHDFSLLPRVGGRN